MVPKIIHCCWFGGAKTKLARKCRASWEKFAHDWEIREFALPQDVPAFVSGALKAKKWAVVSDWARMRALYDEGGVYLDYDVELVRLFVPPEGEWVAGEWTALGGTWMNPGSGIALEKGSPIARHMLEAYEKAVFDPQREMMPWINERLRECADGLAVLAPEVLSAIDMKGQVHVTKATLGIHHYALSWGGPKRKILQWLSWHGCRGLIDALVWMKHALSSSSRNHQPCAKRVASFWEEHCLECAMPLCYRTCKMFERGWHGRCVRVESELKSRVEDEERWGGFVESVRGEGMVRFRRWGKMELMYHGTLIGEKGAARLETWNRRLGWFWRMTGRYHRAIRWRLAAMCGAKGVPNVWRLRMKSEREERLCAAITYEDGREIFREVLPLKAGVEVSFEFALPQIEDGALFRIFPLDGEATGVIEIRENAVEGLPAPRCEGTPGTLLKCVAWDLDGTVWDGTLSEGDDVRLREGIVETIKALDAAGIVNSICSKNDEALALAKLREFGIEEYFVFPQINWGAKSASLKNLAKEMNIGLDAIAFVDDREENRADVRTNCPGVRVLDEAARVEVESGSGTMVFRDSVTTVQLQLGISTSLGARRRVMYREEMVRRRAAGSFEGDAEAFLRESQLQVELVEVKSGSGIVEDKISNTSVQLQLSTSTLISRCLELVNRTNQLTIAGRRYTEAEFASLIATDCAKAVHVWDKYGDYGIVGFVAWNAERVKEMVFSCRVACKGVERRVLEMLPKGLKIDVVETERNAPIRKIVSDWLEEGR